ncbi:ADP-ribose pyrophosphatase [Lactobacillus delbrueckii subsp. bulgaricus]|nr:ADP-ribose pyrophosphatase [Lactobacillus delbrueckii subsp. bulgaricus]MBT8813778.1 ADP-ribose pyrophosphatase [Lactobacillus delbrueckii subsp. bulgaricus]MBT8855709.1 ADP-ribose pyrophosphatase [Lactobacillus delbrueckii subsp. bulgaricus]
MMKKGDKLIDWAMEIQAIGQTGLAYSKDVFDTERYSRLREIAAEMLAEKSAVSYDKVKELFCNEIGYQTPKIATRAAIFKDDQILLVQEKEGHWSLPGGWCDVDQSPADNCIKECWEESGLAVKPVKIIAVQDHFKHHGSIHPYGITDIYYLCQSLGGEFQANSETSQAAWFKEDDLPPLTENKNSTEQVNMCFAAHRDANWQTLFD